MINIGDYVTYVHTYTEPSWSYSYPILYTWASVNPGYCHVCTEVDRIYQGNGKLAYTPGMSLYRTKSYLMHERSAQEYWMNLFDVRADIWCK